MQKRILVAAVLLFLLSAIAGCVQLESESVMTAEAEESLMSEEAETHETIEEYIPHTRSGLRDPKFGVPSYPQFSSVDELLAAYTEAREVGNFTRFASLGAIHLLPTLPEEYRLVRITARVDHWVYKVDYHYAAIEGEITNEKVDEVIADRQDILLVTSDRLPQYFEGGWLKEGTSAEDELKYVCRGMEEIGFGKCYDDKYYFFTDCPLKWGQGNIIFSLYMPQSMSFDPYSDDPDDINAVREVLSYADNMLTIDLHDTANLTAWSAGDFSALARFTSPAAVSYE